MLEELRCCQLSDACMETLFDSLPSTAKILSGTIYHLYDIVGVMKAINMVAVGRTFAGFHLDLTVWGNSLADTIDTYLDEDAGYSWLPDVEIGDMSEYASNEAFWIATDAAYKETVAAAQETLGWTLRRTLEYHRIEYDTRGWPEELTADINLPRQKKMYVQQAFKLLIHSADSS